MYHCKFEKCEKKYSTKFSSIRHFNSSHVPNPVIHTCIECEYSRLLKHTSLHIHSRDRLNAKNKNLDDEFPNSVKNFITWFSYDHLIFYLYT